MSDEEFLNYLRVINDNTRLQIIKMLAKHESLCGCKILSELSITQGTLSHHMRVLNECGIVSYKKDGKWCHYSLNKDVLKDISNFLNILANSGE